MLETGFEFETENYRKKTIVIDLWIISQNNFVLENTLRLWLYASQFFKIFY